MTRLARWLLKIAGQNDEQLTPRTDLEKGLAAIAANNGGGGMRVIHVTHDNLQDTLDITPEELLDNPIPAILIDYIPAEIEGAYPAALYSYIVSVGHADGKYYLVANAIVEGSEATYRSLSKDSNFYKPKMV